MFAPYRSHANSYRQLDLETSVGAASPHRLIAMLFDGALAAIARGRAAMQRGDVAARGEAVGRAIRIVDEGLKASLDPRGGQLAANLRDLYDYIGHRLLVASARNDADALEEAARLLATLQSAWLQIAPEAARTPAAVAA
jgi:flagellar protein FliS